MKVFRDAFRAELVAHVAVIPDEYQAFQATFDLPTEFEYVVCYDRNEEAPLAGFYSIASAIEYLEFLNKTWDNFEGRLVIKSCLMGIEERKMATEGLDDLRSSVRRFLDVRRFGE